MKQKRVLLLVGIPGSGKSTWAQRSLEVNEDNVSSASIVSRDKIRFSLINKANGYFSKEKQVFNLFIKEIQKHLDNGVDEIYVDATHISEASRMKVIKNLRLPVGYAVIPVVFTTSLEECLERNAKRTGLAKVPEHAIKNMFMNCTDPALDNYKYDDIWYYKG